MYEIPMLMDPCLARCRDGWVVEVPEDKALEAIAFSKRNSISGFKVNSFTGATQQTLDTLLATISPSTLVVAGDLEVKILGQNLKNLALGIGTPWPGDLAKSKVEIFTCMESQSAELLPVTIKEVNMHGFSGRDLLPFHEFQKLTKIRLAEAGHLESLTGLSMQATHLEIVKCRKLKDISALRTSNVRIFSADKCPSLSKTTIEEAQNFVRNRGNSV